MKLVKCETDGLMKAAQLTSCKYLMHTKVGIRVKYSAGPPFRAPPTTRGLACLLSSAFYDLSSRQASVLGNRSAQVGLG